MSISKPNFLNTRRGLSLALLGAILLFSFSIPAYGAQGINHQINFQGKVVKSDGTNVADSDYDFVFKIYSTASGGSPVWTENRTGGNQVHVSGGIFRVSLGSVTSLPGSIDFNTDNLYLGIEFNSDGEMTPRVRFTSVPQAFNAEKVNGLSVQNTSGNPFSSTTTLQIADGQSVVFNNGLSFSGTNGTTFTFPSGSGTVITTDSNAVLTNKTIGSTGLTFSGAVTDITTATNEDLTFSPNGSGNIILTSDFDSGVRIGSSSNTSAPLSVTGGIGSNALAIFNQTNSGDIISASASGVTKFVIKNDGTASSAGGFTIDGAGSIQTTNAQTLTLGGSTTGNILINTITPSGAFAGNQISITTAGGGTATSNGLAGGQLYLTTGPGTNGASLGSSGGAGGTILLTTGNGGNPVTSGNGGSAGNLAGCTVVSGACSAGTSTFGTGGVGASHTGGLGGGIYMILGAGGAANTGTSGQGGNFKLATGTGGTNSGASGTSGAGGDFAIAAGPGGTNNGGTSGAGGAISLTAGAAGALGSGIGSTGGAVNLTGGAGSGALAGGAITLLTGAGGATGTAGNFALDVGTSGSGNGSISIGTAARAQTLTLGNVTSTTSIALNSGSGNITLSPTSGNIVLTSDFDTGVLIGSSANTPAPLSISGQIGNNSAMIVNNLNAAGATNDLFAASSAGTTKFVIKNDGTATISGDLVLDSAGSLQTTKFQRLTIGGSSTGNIALMPQNSTGNVGIGTNSPIDHLHVQFSANNNTGITIENKTAGGFAYSQLTFKNDSDANVSIFRNSSVNTFYAGANSLNLYTNSAYPIGFVTNNTLKAILNSSGLFGIGTSSPVSALHVTHPITGIGWVATGKALAIFDQIENQDILTASTGGVTKFTIKNDGTASTSAGFTLDSVGSLQATNMQSLTIGGQSTGNLFLTAGDAGYTILNSDFNSGVKIGSINNTPAVLSVSGGIANNAALIVNNTNSGDILAASASGATKFRILNDGTASTSAGFTIDSVGSLQTTNLQTLTIGGASTGNITVSPQNGSGVLTIGSSTNGVVFDITNSGPTYNGSARPTKTITLSPEYAGAVLTASGSATTNGSLTSDASPSANFRTYYEWTSTQNTVQDYTVAVRFTLPADFSDWTTSNAIQVNYENASNVSATNKLDVYIYKASDSSGKPVYFSTGNVTSAKTWTTINLAKVNLNDGVTPDLTAAGDTAVIYLKMYASGTYNYTHIGDIVINYLSKF